MSLWRPQGWSDKDDQTVLVLFQNIRFVVTLCYNCHEYKVVSNNIRDQPLTCDFWPFSYPNCYPKLGISRNRLFLLHRKSTYSRHQCTHVQHWQTVVSNTDQICVITNTETAICTTHRRCFHQSSRCVRPSVYLVSSNNVSNDVRRSFLSKFWWGSLSSPLKDAHCVHSVLIQSIFESLLVDIEEKRKSYLVEAH